MTDTLTTECIRKKFKNNFDLCNFAIHVARNAIMSGHSAPLGDLLDLVEERADSAEKR
jgi:hypothetical protein